MAVGILLPEIEVVCVDLELGGSHDPVRCDVVRVFWVDIGRVGGVFQIEVKINGAVAAQWGGQGVFIES